MMTNLRHPLAGERWAPLFTAHGPFIVAGYDPEADLVFRRRSDGRVAEAPVSLRRLHEGWMPPPLHVRSHPR